MKRGSSSFQTPAKRPCRAQPHSSVKHQLAELIVALRPGAELHVEKERLAQASITEEMMEVKIFELREVLKRKQQPTTAEEITITPELKEDEESSLSEEGAAHPQLVTLDEISQASDTDEDDIEIKSVTSSESAEEAYNPFHHAILLNDYGPGEGFEHQSNEQDEQEDRCP